MQLATQLFDIPVAVNALIYFKDGFSAYITRRFDIMQNGGKYMQEDMAQLSNRNRQSHGEHFKYEGTYEEIGLLIKKYVAAFQPAMENFFRVVLYNYLFSNGDAHLKNFSLIQSDMGDYTLSPAYDLMSTVMLSPLESDTALDMYKGAMDSSFYDKFGFYGLPDFRDLADKIEIMPSRRDRIISRLLSASNKVREMIGHSFLSEEAKKKYILAYEDKIIRMK